MMPVGNPGFALAEVYPVARMGTWLYRVRCVRIQQVF